MPPLQFPRLRAILDRLDAAPPESAVPVLDDASVVWTLPTPVEWADLRSFYWRTGAIDINGVNVSVQDDSATNITLDRGQDIPRIPLVDFGAYYERIHIQPNGGTVTPITFAVEDLVLSTAGVNQPYTVTRRDVVNAGEALRLGPIYMPPGVALRIRNITQGGAGDTMTIQAQGYTNPAHTPPPLIPAVQVEVSDV